MSLTLCSILLQAQSGLSPQRLRSPSEDRGRMEFVCSDLRKDRSSRHPTMYLGFRCQGDVGGPMCSRGSSSGEKMEEGTSRVESV